ncbi:MAG: PilW family protein [Pseudomonadota bacterium]
MTTKLPHKNCFAARRIAGFTLIELMIALLVSLIILGALSVVYSSAFRTNRFQDGLQRLNENGRYALELMARDIRMAGYYGCAEDKDPMDAAGPVFSGVTTAGGNSAFVTMPIHGFEHSTSGANAVWHPTDIDYEANPVAATNSDAIIVRLSQPLNTSSGNSAEVSSNMGSTLSAISVDDASEVSAGDPMIIGNCENADIFIATAVAGNSITHQTVVTPTDGLENAADSLTAAYETNADIYNFFSIRYDVQADNSNGGIPTLYRKVNMANPEPLVPGVENMQILYGEDTGGRESPDVYRSAADVVNWPLVRTVKIALLLRTEDEFGDEALDGSEASTYDLAGFSFADDTLACDVVSLKPL